MADMDLSLSRRDEDRRVIRNTPGTKVTGYRRIIHPEQSQDGTSCGLCVVASTRVYKSDQLLPLHDECNCGVMPITLDNDPGRELNEMDLQAIYEAAQGNTSGDLLKTKVSFTEHGELGPIISTGNRAGSKQRKAAKDRSPLTPIESVEAQLHDLRKSSAKLEARLARGEDYVRQGLNWQRDRIITLERQRTVLRRR